MMEDDLFIIGFFPYFATVCENEIVQSALVGVNAAVIGAVLGTTVVLVVESFVVETPTLSLTIAGTVVDLFAVALAVVTYWLFVRGVHAAYLILGGGAVGVGAFFLF
jgi:chromate transporter